MPGSLTKFYDDLKNKLNDNNAIDTNNPAPGANPNMRPSGILTHSDLIDYGRMGDRDAWHHKAMHKCHHLKDKCSRHIIIDIYAKILPLDDEYKNGHHGQICNDVDCMLKNKNMGPTQYLTSCYEATKAPLLEFVLRSIDQIGNNYMEEADATIKDAQDSDIKLDEPKEMNPEDPEIENQLVDITDDMQYDTFVDELKKKTIQKIVADITNIINKEKEEDNMTFDTGNIDKSDHIGGADNGDENKNESTVAVGVDYVQEKLWKENIQLSPEQRDELIGMAIREATLNQMDLVFNQPGRAFEEYAVRIRLGKGTIINESVLNYFRNK